MGLLTNHFSVGLLYSFCFKVQVENGTISRTHIFSKVLRSLQSVSIYKTKKQKSKHLGVIALLEGLHFHKPCFTKKNVQENSAKF